MQNLDSFSKDNIYIFYGPSITHKDDNFVKKKKTKKTSDKKI